MMDPGNSSSSSSPKLVQEFQDLQRACTLRMERLAAIKEILIRKGAQGNPQMTLLHKSLLSKDVPSLLLPEARQPGSSATLTQEKEFRNNENNSAAEHSSPPPEARQHSSNAKFFAKTTLAQLQQRQEEMDAVSGGMLPESKVIQKDQIITKMVGRWLSLLSGTLVTTAGTCLAHVSWLVGNDTVTTLKAMRYNCCILFAFVVLGAVFYRYKSTLDAAAKDEEKEPMTEMTPSELLALFVNEGIINLTSAMASIMVQVNYQLLPIAHGPLYMFWIFLLGVAILLIGEFIHRHLKKGSMAEYILNMLNGLNVGSVSWWFGFAMANFTQNMLGAPDGPSLHVFYWMWIVTLLNAILVATVFQIMLSHTVLHMILSPHALQIMLHHIDGMPHGHVVLSIFKGSLMYSSGLVLSDVVQARFTENYLGGTFLWITIGSLVMMEVERLKHAGRGKLANRSCWTDSEKDALLFANEMASLLQHTFAFVCGQLAQFALADWFQVGDVVWLALGWAFQLFGFFVECARHWYLRKLFRDIQKGADLYSMSSKRSVLYRSSTRGIMRMANESR